MGGVYRRGLPPTEKKRGRFFSTPPQGGSDDRREGLWRLVALPPFPKGGAMAVARAVGLAALPRFLGSSSAAMATDITPPLGGSRETGPLAACSTSPFSQGGSDGRSEGRGACSATPLPRQFLRSNGDGHHSPLGGVEKRGLWRLVALPPFPKGGVMAVARAVGLAALPRFLGSSSAAMATDITPPLGGSRETGPLAACSTFPFPKGGVMAVARAVGLAALPRFLGSSSVAMATDITPPLGGSRETVPLAACSTSPFSQGRSDGRSEGRGACSATPLPRQFLRSNGDGHHSPLGGESRNGAFGGL